MKPNSRAYPRNFLILSVILFCSSVHAGGLYISEVTSPATVGTAGVANVVNNFEASAALTNPAGMMGLEKDESLLGLQLLVAEIKFDSDIATGGGKDGGNAGEPALIPGYFLVRTVNENWKFGFSVSGPLGGGFSFSDSFVGRYAVQEIALNGLALTPSFGYRVNERLSIGAGLSLLYSIFNYDLAFNHLIGPDGKVEFDDLDDWSLQGRFGLQYQINDKLLFGFTYLSEADIDLSGDINFKNIRTPIISRLTSTLDDASLGFDLPEAYTIGFQYQYSDRWIFFFDANYEKWSQFSDNLIDISGGPINIIQTIDRDWDDTWHVGFGGTYKLADERHFSRISFGVAYDSSPVSDSKRTLDLALDEQFKIGFSIGKNTPTRRYNVGATLIKSGDARVDQTAQRVRVKGKFDDYLILFVSASMTWKF